MQGAGTLFGVVKIGLMLCAVGVLAHCAADEASESGAFGGGGGSAGAAGSGCIGPSCGTGGTSTGGSAGTGGIPEKELESSFRSPVATGRYVWTANPESSRVARVDAKSFEAATYEAGFNPTHLVGLASPADEDRALVINVGSNDASLFVADAQGEVTVHSAALHQGANAWAVSKSGKVGHCLDEFSPGSRVRTSPRASKTSRFST